MLWPLHLRPCPHRSCQRGLNCRALEAEELEADAPDVLLSRGVDMGEEEQWCAYAALMKH